MVNSTEEMVTLSTQIESRENRLTQMRSQIAQLTTQLAENKMLMGELEHIEDGAEIFKSVGPALVPQNVVSVRKTVADRVKFIQASLEKVEAEHKTLMEEQQKAISQLNAMKSARRPGTQASA